METDKKGISQDAKEYSEQVTRRFTEFIKGIGMKEVSDKVLCNYQALRNSVSGGHNPSLDTLCQVKLGYMEELDINYLFTGERRSDSNRSERHSSDEHVRFLEEQVEELKRDKEFLQDLIRGQTITGQITREINKFLAMTPETDSDVLTKQFAYVKAKIDTELGCRTDMQSEVNTQAFNLMDAYSSEDVGRFFPKKGGPMSAEDKSIVLHRLQDRVTQVRKLIQENF